MLNINDNVIYTSVKIATIINIHHDNAPDVYYTIKLEDQDRYPNTGSNNLHLIKKNGTIIPYDKDDKVLYIKNIPTKIYDIINKNNKFFYKIKDAENFKIVKKNRLTKI